MKDYDLKNTHDAACSAAMQGASLAQHVVHYNGAPDRQAHHRPIAHAYVRLLVSSALRALYWMLADEADRDRVEKIENELEALINDRLPDNCDCEKEVAA